MLYMDMQVLLLFARKRNRKSSDKAFVHHLYNFFSFSKRILLWIAIFINHSTRFISESFAGHFKKCYTLQWFDVFIYFAKWYRSSFLLFFNVNKKRSPASMPSSVEIRYLWYIIKLAVACNVFCKREDYWDWWAHWQHERNVSNGTKHTQTLG